MRVAVVRDRLIMYRSLRGGGHDSMVRRFRTQCIHSVGFSVHAVSGDPRVSGCTRFVGGVSTHAVRVVVGSGCTFFVGLARTQ